MLDMLKTRFEIQKTIGAFYTGGHIEISRDGCQLYCSCDDTVNAIDVETGEKIFQYKKDDDDVTCFCVTPDNEYLVTAGKSLLMHQYGVFDQEVKNSWKIAHKAPVLCMVFDGTSTLLATGSSDTTIKVYDILKKYFTHSFKGSGDVVSLLKFHRNSEKLMLFSASTNGKIRLWNLETSKCVGILEGHFSQVTGLEFTKDLSTLISCGRDKVLIFWDLQYRKQLRAVPVFEHVQAITIIENQFNDVKEECIVTAGETGYLRLWRVSDGKCLYADSTFKTKKENNEKDESTSPTVVQLLKYKKNVIAVTYDHNLLFYSLKDMKVEKQLIGYYDEIVDLKFFGQNEEYIAIATNSEQIKVIHSETQDASILYGHTGTVLCLDVSYNGKYIASASKDNLIRVWYYNEEMCQFYCVGKGEGHTHWAGSVTWSKLSTDFIISGSQDLTIKYWVLPKLPLIEKTVDLTFHWTEKAHEKDINALAVSPNDKIVASASQDKTVKLWKCKSGTYLGTLRGHKRGIWSVAFSPVAQCIATGSGDSSIKIWSLLDFTCLKTFEGHTNSVLRVLFICRGMQVVSSSSEGLIKLWNLQNDECIATFEGHNDKIWALSVSKAEVHMVTGGGDSSIKFWEDVTKDLLEKENLKSEQMIQRDQELANLIHQKRYTEAIEVAIDLDQPYRIHKIVKDLLLSRDGKKHLETVINKLQNQQIETLLFYMCDWNTNSKHAYVTQSVLSLILHSRCPEKLLELSNIKDIIQGLLPYTERHQKRVNLLAQQSMIINYTWESMKLSNI